VLKIFEIACFPDEGLAPSHIYLEYIPLIIAHSRNKFLFATVNLVRIELLFAKNQSRIMYFWVHRNPAINKRKAHKPSPV